MGIQTLRYKECILNPSIQGVPVYHVPVSGLFTDFLRQSRTSVGQSIWTIVIGDVTPPECHTSTIRFTAICIL